MAVNGNGTHHGNGAGPWWKVWKRHRSPDLSAYRRLALQLHHGLPRDERHSRSVLVVTPNETRLAANGCMTLACCMAEELQKPVLLVDGTSNDPALHQMLGSPSSAGLTEFLQDPQRSLQELALPTSQRDVWFLARGALHSTKIPASPEHVHEFVVRAAKLWDFVVIAGGAVLQNSVPLAMAPHVGRVLLLVTENRTYIQDIAAAQNTLEMCKAQNVSLVMTQLSGSAR